MRTVLKSLALLGLLACSTAWADKAKSWGTASDAMAAGLPLLAGVATLANNDTEGTRQLVLSAGSALAAAEVLRTPCTRPALTVRTTRAFRLHTRRWRFLPPPSWTAAMASS